ncbi:Crp/Fnr family transcriptional regulator [Bradyrhizobium jicamae]|uniref:Crp/Fnr family transcriptional regulator n=1 Tax=Bradyrhizobium jicamae TaxID=280332 RepID=A0A0R3M475_9BRAD|nr:Crp/Fnr family transcriptional regulator [Bradyrhizobium jicamae]KRR14826.1 Crp/Fnr family transcriptional regulator [Bradyrhizobium jicamae]
MEIGRPYSRLLLRLERLNALSLDDKQRLIDLPLKIANYSADAEVVSHGDSSSRCTLVLGGFLYSHKSIATSRRQITSFFVPGDVADLSSFYLSKVEHGISALGPTVVAFVPHSSLTEVLDRSPGLARAFWRETLMQAAISQEWIVNLGRRDAIARIAHILCELTARLQMVGLARDLAFSVPWTQMDVADASGISQVHANRVIQELRQLGLVEWDSKHVRIKDWDSLVRLASFDSDYLQSSVEADL